MYIYLDESYNLKDRSKKQFISINGFKTTNIKPIWKQWKHDRRKLAYKGRIHASEKQFESLRNKSLELLIHPNAVLLTVFQIIQEIPVDKNNIYFTKGKLNFELVYQNMLKALFGYLSIDEYKKVVITLDSRKHLEGHLGKKKFRDNIEAYLRNRYKDVLFDFRILPSTSDILLEVADFVSNSFYKQYIGQKIDYLENLELKTIQIKNPLNISRDS